MLALDSAMFCVSPLYLFNADDICILRIFYLDDRLI